jgi:hypothetical protein
VGRVRDNTVTTNAPSTRSRSSSRVEQMGVATAFGRNVQFMRKVEGLVVRLDRGSSNLPRRIFPAFPRFYCGPMVRPFGSTWQHRNARTLSTIWLYKAKK